MVNIGIRDISERVYPFFIAGFSMWRMDGFGVICKENSQHSVNKRVF